MTELLILIVFIIGFFVGYLWDGYRRANDMTGDEDYENSGFNSDYTD